MALTIPAIVPDMTAFDDAAALINANLAVTGTAADFTAANPVLAVGQRGRETDTGLEKIGDGATAWGSLAYDASSGETGSTISAKLSADLAGDGIVQRIGGVLETTEPAPAPSGSGIWTQDSSGVDPVTSIETFADTWDALRAAVVSREAMQTAPFASNTITLDTSVFSRFAHDTNLAANVAVHADSWLGIADAGRTAELRVKCGATGYSLTAPAGTIFNNQPDGVLTPNSYHRFLLGKDGSTPTIYYLGAGVVV